MTTTVKLKPTSCSSTKLLASSSSSFSFSSIFGRRPINYPYRSAAALADLGASSSSDHLSILTSPSRNYSLIAVPVSSSSSQSSQVDLEEAKEDQPLHQQDSRTVHIKLQLRRECHFGEHFFVVGDHPILGSWDPPNAVPLDWSDGHLWTAELDIPLDRAVKFKFILRRINGEILWQPGPDRTLQLWETEKSLLVLEDWEDEEARLVTEEEDIQNQWDDSSVNPEMLIVADNSPTIERLKYSGGNGNEEVLFLNENPEGKPNVEISRNQVIDGEVYVDPEIQDGPVLVPGLSPLSTLLSDDVAMKHHSMLGLNPASTSTEMTSSPESDQKQEETERYTEREEEAAKSMSTHHLTSNEGVKLLNNELQQDHHPTNQNQGEENVAKESFIWENEIRWGTETLKKFLNILLFQ